MFILTNTRNIFWEFINLRFHLWWVKPTLLSCLSLSLVEFLTLAASNWTQPTWHLRGSYFVRILRIATFRFGLSLPLLLHYFLFLHFSSCFGRLIAIFIFCFELIAKFFWCVYLGPRYCTCPFCRTSQLSKSATFWILIDLHCVTNFFFLFFHPLASPFTVHEPCFSILRIFVKHFGPIKETINDSWKIFVLIKRRIVPSDEVFSLRLNQTYQLLFG